ncbi:MAG: hypothetical protein NVSMB1_21290 [Polyangiales bacterium]
MKSRTLLLDLTPWQTPHRFRGIGRYVAELAAALAHALRASNSALRVMGLAWIDEFGEPTLLERLDHLPDIVANADLDPAEAKVRWRRRLHLSAIARKVGADWVHLTDARGTPFPSLQCPKRLITCHDLIPLRLSEHYIGWKDGFVPVRWLRETLRYRRAAHVIAISEETKRDLLRLLKVDATRISVVYNGIDLTRWQPRDGALDPHNVCARLNLTRPFVLYVGGNEWRKNVDHMLAAIAALPDSIDVDLVWAGVLTPREVEEVRTTANRKGVGSRLHLIGFVADDDLRALYQTALAHILVSRVEGFGLTLVEAMASGAPVIATAGSSLAEVVGDAALLVDPDRPQETSLAIERLYRDSSLRAEFARQGRVRAELFGGRVFGEAMLRVYERLPWA